MTSTGETALGVLPRKVEDSTEPADEKMKLQTYYCYYTPQYYYNYYTGYSYTYYYSYCYYTSDYYYTYYYGGSSRNNGAAIGISIAVSIIIIAVAIGCCIRRNIKNRELQNQLLLAN